MFEIVLSAVVMICLIVIVFGCLDCLFKKKNRFEAFGIRDATHAEHNAAFSVDIFDADLSDQVVIEPLPDILSKVSSVPVLRPRITCLARGKQEATLSLLSVQRSFPRNNLTYLNEIGSGWFGKAIESEAVKMVAGSYTSRVVVKMLKDDASKLEQKQFMEEVYAFRCLEHSNLISLLGQCTETTPYLVILEFALYGNLKTYLIQHRNDADTLTASHRRINFARDAASGLACLHRHDYIHNDLAARNCLVMSDYSLKIGDYGVSDYLFKDEYFNTGTELLPVRWMDPDTLVQRDGIWTSQRCSKISDIWSFGILLWEISSLGERPYDELTDESVLQNVVVDRLVLPTDTYSKLPYKVKMWSFMIQCWEESSQRLDVVQVHHNLEQLKIQFDAMVTVSDFDQKWNYFDSKQEKTKKTSLESSRSTLVNDLVTDVPPLEKSSVLYNDFETSDGAISHDVTIDVSRSTHSASGGLDFSARNNVQSLHTAVGKDFGVIQPITSSQSLQQQIMLENKLNKSSVSTTHLTHNLSFDHQAVSATTSDFHGPDSTSQFYSLQSSPSSEYITVSDTHVAIDVQGDAFIEQNSAEKDISLDSMGLSFYELIDETFDDSVSKHDESSILHNYNVASKFISSPQREDEDLSVHIHTSKITENEDFTDFKSAISAGSDSLFGVKNVLESDRCNIYSFKTDVTSSAVVNNIDSKCSELFMSANDVVIAGNDINAHANVQVSSCSSKTSTVDSMPVIFNSVGSSNSYGAIFHSLVGTELTTEPKSNFLRHISEPEVDSGGRNDFTNSLYNDADFQLLESSKGLENTQKTSSDKIHTSTHEISGGNVIFDLDQAVVSTEQVQSECVSTFPTTNSDSSFLIDRLNVGVANEVLLLNSSTYLQEGSLSISDDLQSPAVIDIFEESNNSAVSDIHDEDSEQRSHDSEDHILSNNASHLNEFSSSKMVDISEVGHESVHNSGKSESNSLESGIHSHSATEISVNHVNNCSEVDSSRYINDSVYSQDILLSDSCEAVVQGNDYELDTWPQTSNLYRCSHINLTGDTNSSIEEMENFKSLNTEGHDDNYQEDSQSSADSDAENSNSSSESEQEYICLGQNSSGQPMTSSPDTAVTNVDSAAYLDRDSSSPVEFDEYALQIASEIYLSRGLKSPRVFEIPPLETIPEHQPMPNNHDDSNYTPSDTSSVEVKYEEMFGSDSYEWDDFYGDPLIGREMSLQNTSHQHNLSFKEHAVSDWSMDIDSESIGSNFSAQSEVSLEVSTQSEQLPSQTDSSIDLEKSIRLFSDTESISPSHTRSVNSSKETLVSSILSQFHSPIGPTVSSVYQNNFYSLTEKYDLETDSSSDGLTSPTTIILSTAESPPSFTEHTLSMSPASTSSSSVIVPSGSNIPEQHNILESPVSLAADTNSTETSSTEEESEISRENSKSTLEAVNSLLEHTSDLVTATSNSIISENLKNGVLLGAEDVESAFVTLDVDIALQHGSTYA